MEKASSAQQSLTSRLLWFAGLWVASVLALAAVAFLLKLMIRA